MDPVQRNIVATENLLEALHKDSSLLDDDGFMQRLALLRAKHEQTTRILKREIGLSASYGPETWSHRGCEPYHSRISTATTGRTFVVAEGRRRRSEEEEEDVSRLEDFATSSHVVEEQYFDDLTSIGSVADFASNYEPPTRIEYMQKSYEEEKEEKKGNSEQKKTRISVVKPRAKSRSTTDLSTKASTRQDSAPSNNRSNEFFVPQITLPQPFKLSTRKPLPNTYAKKFLDEMLIEKEKSELAKNKQHEGLLFKANPVPPTTYKSTNPLVNDEKYVNAMRRKVASIAQRRFQQNSLGRSKSEGSLAEP
ncbi:unnamed protein product [Caenorhabditis auriculariae]|uniref:Uncharacterized protein n=1 Tax=Caenorhabditis auriculariae TaxID=2777116 RepID=A0A8S1H7U1_9PELO|nr:unnamed protein product [Caenorhabditis auriculariae]